MKFTNALVAFAFIATSVSLPLRRRDVNPALVPAFQWVSGIDPTGTGNCAGAVNGTNGLPIQIPCSCPPAFDEFLDSLNANVAAGEAVNNPTVKLEFPEDDSNASAITRMQASLVTLQNLHGSGVGCPAVSTTYNAQLAALQQGLPPPPPPFIPGSSSSSSSVAAASASSSAPAAPATSTAAPPPVTTTAAPPPATTTAAATTPASTTASGAVPSFSPGTPATQLSFAQIDSLTPQFGHAAGVNPTGTGNCDGAVIGSNGLPVEVPCSCPPDRTLFINDLIANIAVGHAVNNTVVTFTFPTDDSADSQHARFNAASDTLQNLQGPGVGCPIASTTWQAQNAAIQG